MNIDELRELYEHNDSYKDNAFKLAVFEILDDDKPDKLSRIGQLRDAAQTGDRLLWAKIKGGFADEV